MQDLVDRASNGFAGRGADLNEALAGLNPVLGHLGPVMANLRRRAHARCAARSAGSTSRRGAAAPVSAQLGSLVDGAAATLGSLDAARDGLGGTLDRAPATMRDATSDLHAMSPVLADAARLAIGLRPGADLLPRAPPAGWPTPRRPARPVLRRATRLGPDLEDLLRALGALSKDPATSGAVARLTKVVASLGPTLRFINPFQTQCNYLGLWTRNASSTISEGDENGTWFRFIPVFQTDEFLQRADAGAAAARHAVRQRDRQRVRDRQRALPARPADRPPGRAAAQPHRADRAAGRHAGGAAMTSRRKAVLWVRP